MSLNPKLTFSILCDHTSDGLRSGEGAMIELKDGGILFCFTVFEGASDESRAHIAKVVSRDGGESWSPVEVLFEAPSDALNAMSVSLVRLEDGRIGCSYLVKWSTDWCVPVWVTSADEGQTWSEPKTMTPDKQYFSINNDRLLRLKDGTILLPYSVKVTPEKDMHDGKFPASANKRCGLFYSRDNGESWERSAHEVTHTPDVFVRPFYSLNEKELHPDVQYLLEERLGIFQEPGVEQLKDGRLLMYMRSSYVIYHCFAESVCSPWTRCEPLSDFNVCCGPQTIRREPRSGALVMLYNDRGEVPFGAKEYSWRTPLSVAISEDEARTWKRLPGIEDDRHNYCYYTLLFLRDHFVLSYYESANSMNGEEEIRRNLASLKICTGPTEFFTKFVKRDAH